MRIAGRLSVLALTLLFVAGHVGLCAAMGLVARQAADAGAPPCPLHQTAPSDTALRAATGSTSVSCCAPVDGRGSVPAAPASSSFAGIDPAERVGVVLPRQAARPYGPRARDSAPATAVPLRLLFSVFLV